MRKTSESADEGCGIKSRLPFSSHLLSFAHGSICPGLLVPQSPWRVGRGSCFWAVCDRASDLNPINSWNVGPLGLNSSSSFGKNCFRPAGYRRITEEKIQPGWERALTFHTRSPEAALAPVGFSGHLPERSLLPGFGHSPSQVTLPDKPADWFLPFWRISSSIF